MINVSLLVHTNISRQKIFDSVDSWVWGNVLDYVRRPLDFATIWPLKHYVWGISEHKPEFSPTQYNEVLNKIA
jgi:hypothetical protein